MHREIILQHMLGFGFFGGVDEIGGNKNASKTAKN